MHYEYVKHDVERRVFEHRQRRERRRQVLLDHPGIMSHRGVGDPGYIRPPGHWDYLCELLTEINVSYTRAVLDKVPLSGMGTIETFQLSDYFTDSPPPSSQILMDTISTIPSPS